MEEIMNRSESSFEVTRNAKNQFQFTVKIYGDNAEKSLEQLNKAVEELNKKYPFI